MALRSMRHIETENKVLEAIKQGYNKLYKIGIFVNTIDDAELDRALQRLRREDKIKFHSTLGWSVVEKVDE